ncbi:hypothetical protein PIB30_075014 [Stylosanthes scabra]|uniref:BHLH domain-containing protein n=1 Tax=Stylosanthes scabra TaxID=79078 RepID=A0ABU6QPL0_9FABA|nr:hypothetical protein [Stylosanthes scabra]
MEVGGAVVVTIHHPLSAAISFTSELRLTHRLRLREALAILYVSILILREQRIVFLATRINKRIRSLKELIPNCNKNDKASTLDDAIDYLKTLKLQLQIMSMGSGVCMPMMMLPNHQNQLMGGGTGMCYRPSGTGIPQFHIPHAAAITDWQE